jgi:acyl-CoA dehydrogenase
MDIERIPDPFPVESSIGDAWQHAIYPLSFEARPSLRNGAHDVYLQDPAAFQLMDFFADKGLKRLKEEDRQEQWYDDWLSYQAKQGIYASLLSPAKYSSRGGSFDMFRYARFLELFAYCSPAHGYSLQVTFLGLYAILLGSSETLKREAIAALEGGGLLAFAVSEREHGSDLLANEFLVHEDGNGGYIANGAKYYIGNAATASLISILARKRGGADERQSGRDPFILFALRPASGEAPPNVTKIHTLGVRAAFVGSFDVKEHKFSNSDIAATGHDAWDAAFGTITLGKFFLGFGSIGICEHAFHEALAHLRSRILYGRPVIDMPHIQSAIAEAYARLTGMKLYAFRALDYLHVAHADDRRYLLFCAVQKARVSTEALKVMALLSECVGAWGFESDTFFEMALRDVQLIPGLEGSMHINLRLTNQFMPRYFDNPDRKLSAPPSLAGAQAPASENPYLYEPSSKSTRTISFTSFLQPYRELANIPNVAIFARQSAAFRRLAKSLQNRDKSDLLLNITLGRCMAVIAYGQLVAENAVIMQLPPALISLVFAQQVTDLATHAFQFATMPQFPPESRKLVDALIRLPEPFGAFSAYACTGMAPANP